MKYIKRVIKKWSNKHFHDKRFKAFIKHHFPSFLENRPSESFNIYLNNVNTTEHKVIKHK